MKKIFSLILMTVLLLTLVPAAQAASRKTCPQPTCAFQDAGQNGVCDKDGSHFVDENGDGVCDNPSEACEKAFADQNSDGICDNRSQSCQPRAALGHHNQGHRSQGHHGR